MAAVIWSMSGAESRTYRVTSNDNVRESLEKEMSGPEASLSPVEEDLERLRGDLKSRLQ